jgi:hypothetical protein
MDEAGADGHSSLMQWRSALTLRKKSMGHPGYVQADAAIDRR